MFICSYANSYLPICDFVLSKMCNFHRQAFFAKPAVLWRANSCSRLPAQHLNCTRIRRSKLP